MAETDTQQTQTTATTAPRFATVAKANEWGQITDLEPHTAYFVLKRPAVVDSAGAAASKPKDYLEELKSFLHEHRVLAKKQLEEMKGRYGDPSEKAKEVRVKVEQKFDQVARQLEERYEKLETDLEQNLDRILGKKKNGSDNGSTPTTEAPAGSTATTAAPPETPGEMPRGDEPAKGTDASDAAESKKGGKKNTAAKAEKAE